MFYKFMYFGIVLNTIFVWQSLETFLTYRKVYEKHPKSGFKIKRILLIVHFEQTNASIKWNQANLKWTEKNQWFFVVSEACH